MPCKTLDRRTLLRGAGVAVALPALEAMLDGGGRAYGAGGTPIPKRYLICFGGQSLGDSGDPVHNLYAPDTEGPLGTLKTALAPLEAVKGEVTVVSGLSIPYRKAGTPPPGGWSIWFHHNALGPLLSGMRSDDPIGAWPRGPSSDQIAALALGPGRKVRSLEYKVQAGVYQQGDQPNWRQISYRRDDAGKIVPVNPESSPRQAWSRLFDGFVAADPTEAARRRFVQRQRASILDFVIADARALAAKLGAADRARLDQHLTEVRTLEGEITTITDPGGACAAAPDPGPDPAVAGETPPDSQESYADTNWWSNEDARARVFCDLLAMAFVCDLTRAASLMFTHFESFMNAYPLTGNKTDVHGLSHGGGGTVGVSKAVAWHMKHFATLIRKLRDQSEGAGRLIDNMAMVFLHEGGHGFSPENGEPNMAHSTENMCCLVAGRAGGLRPGRHVIARDKHPGNVVVSALNAAGVMTESFGEVSGGLSALF